MHSYQRAHTTCFHQRANEKSTKTAWHAYLYSVAKGGGINLLLRETQKCYLRIGTQHTRNSAQLRNNTTNGTSPESQYGVPYTTPIQKLMATRHQTMGRKEVIGGLVGKICKQREQCPS